MNMAQKGDRVKVDYTGKLENGEVFVTSNDSDPVKFNIGDGKILPAFEEGIIGMSIGEKKTITVPPEKAFGFKKQDLIVNVGRSTFKNTTPEIGKKFGLQMKDGKNFEAVVVRTEKEMVTMDANHPLAGETLKFDVQLLEIV